MTIAHDGAEEPRQDGGQQQEELMDALDIQAEATARAETTDTQAVSREIARVRRNVAAGPHIDSRLGRAGRRRRQARAAAGRQSGKASMEGWPADQDNQDDDCQAATLQQKAEGYGTDLEQQHAGQDLSQAPRGLKNGQGELPQADLGGIRVVDPETLGETVGAGLSGEAVRDLDNASEDAGPLQDRDESPPTVSEDAGPLQDRDESPPTVVVVISEAVNGEHVPYEERPRYRERTQAPGRKRRPPRPVYPNSRGHGPSAVGSRLGQRSGHARPQLPHLSPSVPEPEMPKLRPSPMIPHRPPPGFRPPRLPGNRGPRLR